jgi:hypothetical protein
VHVVTVGGSSHRCEPITDGAAAIVTRDEGPSAVTVIKMPSAVRHHLDCVDVSSNRLRNANCAVHCSLHIGRVVDRDKESWLSGH